MLELDSATGCGCVVGIAAMLGAWAEASVRVAAGAAVGAVVVTDGIVEATVEVTTACELTAGTGAVVTFAADATAVVG